MQSAKPARGSAARFAGVSTVQDTVHINTPLFQRFRERFGEAD